MPGSLHVDDASNARMIEMLRADIDRRADRTALARERQSRGLFEELILQDRPPTFAEIKTLLGHSSR